MVRLEEIYWPLAVVLPYLGEREDLMFKENNKEIKESGKKTPLNNHTKQKIHKHLNQFKINTSD